MKTTVSDAMPAGEAAGRPRRTDAYIVSSNDLLLLEMGPALGDRFRTRPIERMEELPGAEAAPWIGFIDGARPDARSWIQHIEKHLPRGVLIVVTDSADLAGWQAMVFRGTLCAALSTAQIGTAALQEALSRAQERLRHAQAQASPQADSRAVPLATGWPAAIAAVPTWAWIAVAAVLLVSTGLWRVFASHSTSAVVSKAAPESGSTLPGTALPGTARVPVAAAELSPPPAPQRPVVELLSAARSAFRDPDRQLPRPDSHGRGDSALELYAQVLTQDAANGEARDGLRRLLAVGRSRLQSDLAANHMEDAQRLLAVFHAAALDPNVLKQMDGDLAAAQPRWFFSQARRALAANDVATAEQAYSQLNALGADRTALQDLRRTLDSRQADAQLQSLADEVRTAIVAGNLLEPAASSARTRLLAMRQANRAHPLTLAAQRELQDALIARAHESQTAGQLDAAQRWLTAAAELGSSNEITEFRRQLQAEVDRPATRPAAAAGIATPAATQAAASNATSPAALPTLATAPAGTAPSAPHYLPARPVNGLKALNYPAAAMRSGVKGSVLIEFTLNADGGATDVQVIDSTPAGVFDKSALEAVSRTRFDASVRTGSGIQRARLRIAFKPD